MVVHLLARGRHKDRTMAVQPARDATHAHHIDGGRSPPTGGGYQQRDGRSYHGAIFRTLLASDVMLISFDLQMEAEQVTPGVCRVAA